MTTTTKPISSGQAFSSLIAVATHRASMAAKIIVAIALALTPITAVLVLGWIVRLMRRESIISLLRLSRSCSRGDAIAHLGASEPLSSHARFPGWWSGLWTTITSGFKALAVVAILTLPFSLLLLLSWWAGWENSFNKGYEQAWVGPAIALVGIVLAVAILSHLPMAFARFAAEGSIWSVTELRQIRRQIHLVRWRYLVLTLATVFAAAPLFLAQILPTFMEKINPKVLTAEPEELRAIAGRWHLMATIYLIFVVFYLRRWAARIYARSILLEPNLAGRATQRAIKDLDLSTTSQLKHTRHWAGMVVTTVLGVAAWGSFIVMLYIAQFANHAWWNWVNHGLTAIPWIFRPL